MDLNDILVFARVVQAGSFVGASRLLDMPSSTVSRRVSQLETRLEARLLQRTTRSVRLTSVGRVYYEHAARILAEMEQGRLAVSNLQRSPQGRIRVAAPLGFHPLGVALASFLSRYPDVALDVSCSDRSVSLVEEDVDLAVRIGPLPDSNWVARRLGTMCHVVVAAPSFLDKNERVSDPAMLERLPTAAFDVGGLRHRWYLESRGQTFVVKVQPRLVVNELDILRELLLTGQVLGLLPSYYVAADFKAGRLVHLLPEWRSPEVPVHAVYASARHLSPTVTALVAHLQEKLTW